MSADDAGTPRLRVEFRHVQALSSRGNHRIRLEPDGALFVDVVTRDCPRGVAWIGEWPAVPARRLAPAEIDALIETIIGSGFFDLPGEMVQRGHDGFREELDVEIDERSHSVAIERVAPPLPFVRVRAALWRLAGSPLSG